MGSILHVPQMRGQLVTSPTSSRLAKTVLAAERPPLHVVTPHSSLTSTAAARSARSLRLHPLARWYPAGLQSPGASLRLEEQLSFKFGRHASRNLHFFPSIDGNSKWGIFSEDSARLQYQILAACVKKSIAQGRGKETQ